MNPRLEADLLILFLCVRINRYLLAVSSDSLITDNTVNQSKQSVIAALTYVCTGMNSGTALSVKDVAGLCKLTVASLRAQSLGLGISSVLGGTYTFLMSKKLKIQI